MFRGQYKYDDEEAGLKYAQEVWEWGNKLKNCKGPALHAKFPIFI